MYEMICMMNRMKETQDGPTAVFYAGTLELGWLNLFGFIIVILMLVPNIIYGVKYKDRQNLCTNKVMTSLEQIGRFASIFLMVFHIGVGELGFRSIIAFFMYFFGNIVLLLAYFVIWIMFFYKNTLKKGMALAIIPTFLFLLSGLTMGHVLLVCSAIIFGIGHIYVSYVNYKD